MTFKTFIEDHEPRGISLPWVSGHSFKKRRALSTSVGIVDKDKSVDYCKCKEICRLEGPLAILQHFKTNKKY
jgi:hypothetical protein